jgi:hypothetical protein
MFTNRRIVVLLEGIEAVPEQINRDMVEQGGEPHTLILAMSSCNASSRSVERKDSVGGEPG